jgi:hypothetical protein
LQAGQVKWDTAEGCHEEKLVEEDTEDECDH